MKNLICNVKNGSDMRIDNEQYYSFDLAKKIAELHTEKTGNKCVIDRILDYTDSYDNNVRYHFSFDIYEILD